MKKILYVEDHEDTARAVQTILSEVGFEVDIASTGKAAIKKAKKNQFDLILLDIMLPDMSGWDVFQALKKKIKNVKYVILSVIPVTPERKIELKKAGITEYIIKPFEKKNLIGIVRKVLK
jgi:DNA-binding response OmpR family regulator